MANFKAKIKDVWDLIKTAFKEWRRPNPWRLSAILSYYAIIALPGLLVIVITLVGLFFNKEGVQLQIEQQLAEMIGSNAAAMINTMVEEATDAEEFTLENIFGIATLIFGSTGVFFHLQRSLNDIWEVKQKPKTGIKKIALDRVFSFGMVLAIAFLLLVSLLLSTFLGVVQNWLMDILPRQVIYLFIITNWVLTLLIIAFLYTIMFKFLPDVKLHWKPALAGGLLTALLFVISEYLISYYFQQSDQASLYGAAGFLVVMMLWITYTGLILFFGAAFTKAFVKKYNYNIETTRMAVKNRY